MSEWKTTRIRDVAEVYDGPHATPKKVEKGPWYLSISSLHRGQLDLSKSVHISEVDFPKWTRRVAPQVGDTLFSYETRLGQAAYWALEAEAALGRRMGLLRPKRGLIEPRYLCYAYLGPQFQEVIRQHTLSGATVDRIPVGEMPNWPILLPSLETQRAVLSVLNSIDGLIENNRRRIEVLEEMARAIYREWFVKFRFPGHQDVRLVNSELGLTPEGWDLVAASDVLLINPRIKLDKGVSHPFINMGDLSEKGMSCRPSEYRSGGSGSKFVVGDTLFSRITPCLQNGKTGLVQTLGDSEVGRGSTEFIVLRGRLVGSAYTYCLARNEHFRAYAEASMSGASGRQRVRNECFDSYMIAVPPRELAQQFEQASQPMFAQIRILTDETLTLVRLRDRLLPKLVTGQIDVSGLDLEAVDAKEEAG
ncbi:restriction endonuclease subunit S [Actinomyces sp. HMSC035G02]|uniref:restriction endonuclease subunit S n=1 Tax=Actinomyces sp. HMSC035G02 TaxID=1739406 RepID=UPI0009F66BBA|nr:restriction endonuclease subunit S [Actinomyces sp. HMSC035G02]